jgi:hypothetical protein
MSLPTTEATELVAILIQKHDCSDCSERCICAEIREIPQIQEALAAPQCDPILPIEPHKMGKCAAFGTSSPPRVKIRAS